jgi:hypothetical protein
MLSCTTTRPSTASHAWLGPTPVWPAPLRAQHVQTELCRALAQLLAAVAPTVPHVLAGRKHSVLRTFHPTFRRVAHNPTVRLQPLTLLHPPPLRSLYSHAAATTAVSKPRTAKVTNSATRVRSATGVLAGRSTSRVCPGRTKAQRVSQHAIRARQEVSSPDLEVPPACPAKKATSAQRALPPWSPAEVLPSTARPARHQ